MPYTPDELVTLPAEVIDLVNAIRDARRADGDGGVKVTKAERRKILREAAQLAFLLARDGLD